MSFVAEHMSRTQEIRLHAPPSQVFPLFEPVGEKQWAADWNPTMLFPADETAQVGTVFTSQHLDGRETIWTITAYDPATCHLTYLRVTPDSVVGIIDVQCQASPDGATQATITYTYTALSEAGNTFLIRFTATHYQHEMALWEQAINHYLQHGEPLRHH